MAQFPAHPNAVTAGWLSDVLGRRIDTLRWEPIGTGQVGDSVRFHLLGEDAPGSIAAKFPAADSVSRSTAVMFNLYAKEVAFYREVATQLGVRVPKVYFSEIDERSGDFILLLEDLGPARQGDQIHGCSETEARAAICQAAAIHAPSWQNESILTADWLQPPEELGSKVAAMYPQAQAIFRERYARDLEPEFMALCEELAQLAPSFFRREGDAQCVVHGDFRLDNMLFDIGGGAETVAVLDWQTVAVGKAMTDVGYFIGCGIGERHWRTSEEALLALWLSEMATRGVRLSREDIWEDYRRGILHGVSTAVFSAAFVERTERGDANFLSMARGACSLALARDSIGALKEKQ